MTVKEIVSHIDHTQLKAFATWEDIVKLCDEAIEFGTASVCVPPCYVKRIRQKYGKRLNICTVIGFPLGYSVTEVKVAEARQALEDGAEEIDMVINISDVKNGDYDKGHHRNLLSDGRGEDCHVQGGHGCGSGIY